MSETITREIKSSLFIDYFGLDEVVGKQNFLELYNALHDTHYTMENCVLKLRLIDDTVYKTYKNDLGMEINGRLVILMEHQSTINNNMPLRFLEYITRIYSSIIPGRARYLQKTYKIPTPEFFVFYNGKDEIPEKLELKLSDAFLEQIDNTPLELKVKVFNIGNLDLPLLKKCDKIKEYTKFINFVYEKADLQNADSCKEVVRQAKQQGLMPNYLERKILEVENMLCAKYDYDLDIQVKQEEAFEDGLEKGKAIGITQGISQGITQGISQALIETAKKMLANNCDVDFIKQITTLSDEEIAKINRG